MLVYAEIYFEPTIYCEVEGGFPCLKKEFEEEVWWLTGRYCDVVDENKVDDFRARMVEKIKSEANKYHVGDRCPFGDFIVPRTFVSRPSICPNFKRMETTPLKDMSTEKVLKIATIPQILQEFGELKIS